MKAVALQASISALVAIIATAAQAQRISAGGFRSPPPPPPPPVAFPGVFVIEREVPVIVERQAPPSPTNLGTPNTDVPKLPSEPWVLGKRYASLPSGCMKLIAGSGRATYYHCSGHWYRQLGEAQYRAVVAPLLARIPTPRSGMTKEGVLPEIARTSASPHPCPAPSKGEIAAALGALTNLSARSVASSLLHRRSQSPVGFCMRIELNCAQCGNNRFSLDQGMTDQSLVVCEDCGHEIGTLARLKQMVAEQVLRQSSREPDAA